MIRKTLIASICLLTLSIVAFGARATDSYDNLESAVQGLQAELPDTLDKTQKKAAKAYKSTLKKLGKDTDSLKKEIKLGKSIAGKLSKLGNATVDNALDGAADDLQSDVIDALQAAQSKLNSVAGKVKPSKVQKQIDAGFEASERAASEDNVKKRFALLGKGEARARKADKLADKLSGGGGGKNACDFPGPGAGESGTVTFDGVEYTANILEVVARFDPGPDVSSTSITVGFCAENGNTFKVLGITLDGEPDVGFYSANLMGGGASVTELLPNDGGGFVKFGTVEITSRETGKVSGTFTTRQDIDPPILATFTFDDPITN